MKRIGILGIGGVGGYFGGLMAMNLEDDPSYEIVFIARGKTKSVIRKKGLWLQTIEDSFMIHPTVVSDDPKDIGQLDMLIPAVKSYSLRDATEKYVNNVKTGGTILTLQNSVNQQELLAPVLRKDINHLLGCVYIISNIKSPGHIIRQKGPDRISFGHPKGEMNAFLWIQKMFDEARINAKMVSNIHETIWNKYLFISPVATATSYFQCPIGEVAVDPEKRNFLEALIIEAREVAMKLGIRTKSDMQKEVLEICGNLNHHSKSSMQLDFENGRPTELAGLTQYIIDSSTELGLTADHYQRAFEQLK